MLMDLDNLAGKTGNHDALAKVVAQVEDWCSRHAGTEAMLAKLVANPTKSLLHFSPDMSGAEKQLALVSKGLEAVRKLATVLSRPDFLALDPAKQQAVGKQIDFQMWSVKNAVQETIEAIKRAGMDLAKLDEAVADGLLKADKFVVDVVPEIVGAIATAITLNKKAGKVAENADKVIQRVFTEGSHVLQGGEAGGLDKEIGSLQDKAIEAAIDTAATFVFGPVEGVKGALRMLGTCMVRDALKAAVGKEGEEAHKAMIAGATEGFFSAVEEIAKECPGLKEKAVQQKVVTFLLKSLSGAGKAVAEGNPAEEGLAEGMAKGAVAVGAETLIHHASGHGGTHAAPHATPKIDAAAIGKLRDRWVQSTFSVTIYPAQ